MKTLTGRLWALDGSYYTENIQQIINIIGADFMPQKQDYTICDRYGNAIALAQIFTREE